MAGRGVSPGAALLRSSRMFSMPAPIPAPPGDYASATKHHSETATINFPTHLSVTTPSSSRITGDWGFKRPFPLKTTTKTTIPLVRVRQVDSTEHVTDFQSSSDHAMTLKKFQDLNLPISVPLSDESSRNPQSTNEKSVFEDEGDVTAIDAEEAVRLENKRWKFKGPWLAGMTDGEFDKYLEKVVRTRRSEFRGYLRELLAKEMTEEQEKKAREAAVDIPEPVAVSSISEVQLTEFIKKKRSDRPELYKLVGRFLDLAPVSLDVQLRGLAGWAVGAAKNVEKAGPYAATGPPITHPSAGLSYLRTRNFQTNHAIYGPQKYHPPVKVRVLSPRYAPTGQFKPAIGVAGFVADTSGDTMFNESKLQSNQSAEKGLLTLELDKVGGTKLYGQTNSASVDSTGRVRVTLGNPSPEGQVIQKEAVGEPGGRRVYEEALQETRTREVPRNPRGAVRPRSRPMQGNSQNYGLGQRDFGRGL